jgi:hypothetical protein
MKEAATHKVFFGCIKDFGFHPSEVERHGRTFSIIP